MQNFRLRFAVISVLSFSVHVATTTLTTTAQAADDNISFECDGVINNLIKNSHGCPTGNCRYKISNGKMEGFNSGVVKKDGDRSSMATVSEANNEHDGITNLEIVKGKKGAQELTFTRISATGRATTMQYDFTATKDTCVHNQTQSKERGDSGFAVDYDPDFCSAALDAFSGLDAVQAKTCDDSMMSLVSSFEKRSNELSKERKIFHGAGFFEKAKALTVSVNSGGNQGQIMRAMKQRDRCMAATAEINAARPLKFRPLSVESILTPRLMSGESFRNFDKRAYPISKERDWPAKQRKTAP